MMQAAAEHCYWISINAFRGSRTDAHLALRQPVPGFEPLSRHERLCR
jgi:hypothetical protein